MVADRVRRSCGRAQLHSQADAALYAAKAGQGYHLGRPGPMEQAVPIVAPVAVGMTGWRQSIGLPSVS